MTLPVIVKARLHWTPGASSASGRVPASLCRTAEEVQAALAEVAAAGGNAVVQEVVDGELMAVTALCAPGGRVVAESQQVAERVSPRLRVSSRARTVAIEPELSASVGRLLGELGWFGIANLQFLRPVNGAPQLIDFNGRFYGSIVLAVAAGLDLPATWATLALTGADAAGSALPTRGRPGVRYQSLEEDLRRARLERRGGLLGDVAGTLGYAARAVHSTWDRTDPMPAVSRLGELLSRRTGRAAARFQEGSA
jgi:predicted ATP-grasp superfamily ATP-dependent carboligase